MLFRLLHNPRVRACVMALASLLCLLSCKREQSLEFCEVTLRLAVPEEVKTEKLRAFIYDSDNGDYCGELLMSGSDGVFAATQNMRAGTFDIVAYNFDLPDTYIRGKEKITTLEAYTEEIRDVIRARYGDAVASKGSIFYTPDKLAVARIRNAEFKAGAVISGRLESVMSNTDISLAADGLAWSTTRSAVVTSFPTSYFLGTGKPGAAGSLYFELEKTGGSTLSAMVPSFGTGGDTFEFVINVTTSDGSYNYQATTDGSFKFDKAISIPEPSSQKGGSTGGSGFVPQVGQWNDISLDVPIS